MPTGLEPPKVESVEYKNQTTVEHSVKSEEFVVGTEKVTIKTTSDITTETTVENVG